MQTYTTTPEEALELYPQHPWNIYQYTITQLNDWWEANNAKIEMFSHIQFAYLVANLTTPYYILKAIQQPMLNLLEQYREECPFGKQSSYSTLSAEVLQNAITDYYNHPSVIAYTAEKFGVDENAVPVDWLAEIL